MQHIAESCRRLESHHVGIDGPRQTSYGSSIAKHGAHNSFDTARQAYDSIEAEIDQLKDNVLKLKREADKDRTEPKTEQELAIDKYLSTRSARRPPGLPEPVQESAAARLQRQHEALKSEDTVCILEKPLSPPTPSPLDFPALAQSKSSATAASVTGSRGQIRRPSYAHAATIGMSTGKPRSDSKLSDSISNDMESRHSLASISTASRVQTGSTVLTQDSEEAKDDEHSVIVLSEQRISTSSARDEPTNAAKDKPSTPIGKTVRQSPRFAQPTKSFARRAGETLRKDSASVSPRSPAEGSPTKPTKAKEPDLATTKRASQQKRKSLPGEWLNPFAQSRDEVSPIPGSKVDSSPMGASSSAINRDSSSLIAGDAADGLQKTKSAISLKLTKKDSQPQSPPRKKNSSYMAPTSATTQRTIATLGAEKMKRDSGQVTIPETQVEITQSTESISLSPRSQTAASDNSSVQFILERPNGDAKPFENRDTSKHQQHGEVHKPTQTQNRSPLTAKSAVSVRPEGIERSKLVKVPKDSSFVKRQTKDQHSRNDSRSADVLTPLPEVSNTTTKRRTSHGHLLTPIVACLDAKGLLNKSSNKNAVVEAYLQKTASGTLSNAVHAARQKTPGRVGRRSEEDTTDAQIQQQNAPSKVLPPHLRRSRETSTASASTDVTIGQEQLRDMTLTGHSRDVSSMAIPLQDFVAPPGMPVIGQSMKPLVKSSTIPTLRATAKEFIPTPPLMDDMALGDWSDALDWVPANLWATMSSDMKRKILALRELNKPHRWLSPNTLPFQRQPPGAPFKHVSHRSWQGIAPQPSVTVPAVNFIDDNGSPHNVEAGQVLKPCVSPGKKNVQWMMQGLNGKETPIKFGRAPPPPSTPTISSASDDTSPFKTPHSVRRWQIGSTFSPAPYGWTGGDGKEIRFLGYGPHAEQDPIGVVNFNFHGRTSSFGTTVPNGFIENKENVPSREYVAPKSQRQWAEKLDYRKVTCGNVEITHAVEQIPFGPQLANYCHDCMAK